MTAPLPEGWKPLEEAKPYNDYYVWLLIDGPKGVRPGIGMFRKGVFWGREVEGWWTKESISENGRPTFGMWIDGWVKAWRPYSLTPPVL